MINAPKTHVIFSQNSRDIFPGHVRTLCKFVRESSDKCLEKVMTVLSGIFDAEKKSGKSKDRTFTQFYL